MKKLKVCKNCVECLDRATQFWGFITMDCSKCPRVIETWNRRK